MDTPTRQRWVGTAVIVGVTYFVIGRVFTWPTDHLGAWRLAAWMVSGAVYGIHITYEHFRLHDSPPWLALHAALAAALGAFGLAVAGMIHSLWAASGFRLSWLVALVAWPVITGIPAFVVALAAGAVLARRRRPPAGRGRC